MTQENAEKPEQVPETIPPNQTLYVRNLNEKAKPEGIAF